MYELLLFTGGIYKFNEFKEFIDDLGGLIIEMESFKVSRGMYFLSEEVKVLILVPIGEKKEITHFAKKIKGSIEPVLMEEKECEKVILIFEIYKKLKINELTSIEIIIDHLINNTNFIEIKNLKNELPYEKYEKNKIERSITNFQIKKENYKKEEFLEKIIDLLIIMEKMKIIETVEKKESAYFKIRIHE
ncbi:MAG: hypothetical protein ISP01_00735 [Methanobrevibacter arboriphilus]|jgi:hypothetical protein|uniref:Uncharacterized protein n=2 Tax=Methanobrevibacter arboriphilus TaxID=39441 RepID=A0ACA8R3P2_METAZ|nr:methyl-coenzyme M reductase family protein [Methanobrevibacter arboriphilus]MBF4467906.1 hypothetical protein [Methanobrevibacter arboriphilus]MCC7561952.1 hypothetical protein [Methanobrevibacter arboriphilus]BBL61455.1 hypothetical protein MarbSA_04950 [Methanobrevibacter arboriphilus]GLI11214.1 hypothetical protein MARBORIA2_03040 [Methanobrevibacter arboriphilus]